MEKTPVLQIKNISKQFPAVQALSDVSLDIYPGEVHAIIGENGAGKSTLMKIISGVYHPDGGTIILNGTPVHFNSPTHAISLGIGMVYQELSVFPAATVAENIFANRLPVRGIINAVDQALMVKRAKEVFAPFGISIDVNKPLRDLRFSEQQITEICKAISLDARILLLDEPTSALTTTEIKILFEIIRRLKAAGVAIIYISHHISEILEIADTVTVLRDGLKIATLPACEATPDSLVRMMVGRTIDTYYPPHVSPSSEIVLEIRNLKTDLLKDISFNVQRGEIFGVAGLVGSGRTELLQAIFGLYPVQSGEFYLEGTRIFIHSLHDAMAVGIGFSPEDRRKQSLYMNLGVADNILVTTLKQVTRLGFIVRKEAARRANDFVKLLAIRTSSLDQPVINLSGGNQQKTVLARWLAIHPKVLLLDDPTAGIDAGAKHEIYKILTDLTASGVIVVLVSSELPELLGLCDRLAVMCAGRLATVLERSNFNEELVMAYAAGIRSD